ncbi:hypothetical protein [Halobacteriovorax sp.]|uniref:hypothetical protein n=1 Tax=Halobacteriovorax sp. TaxID=2020862 RepID=UPI003562AFDB
MTKVHFLISSLLLLNLNLSFADSGSFKKKVSRKIASVFQEKKGNNVFDEFIACKNTEKNSTYFTNVSSCMSKYFPKEMSESNKVDLVIFMLSGSSFSSLSKCTFEVLENHPSVIDNENDFVLCSDYLKGKKQRKRTALFYFDQRGKRLEILDIRD